MDDALWAAGSAFQAMGEQSAGWVAGTDRREKVAGKKRELGAISAMKSGIMWDSAGKNGSKPAVRT